MLAIVVAAAALRLNSFYGAVRACSLRQDLAGAGGQELRADASAQSGGVAPRSTFLRPQGAAAIQRDHDRDELQRVVFDRNRQGAHRRLASTAKGRYDGPLGDERGVRGRIVDWPHGAARR